MHEIILIATIGEEKFTYSAVMPFKSGRTDWDLFIGDFYQGSLNYHLGAWRAYLAQGRKNDHISWLTTEDIQVLIEEIESRRTNKEKSKLHPDT